MNIAAATQKVVAALLARPEIKKATVYLSEKSVVSVCRRFKPRKRNTRDDYVLKIGAPNYLERQFLRLCRKAGEPIPVRKVQLRRWPVTRVAHS